MDWKKIPTFPDYEMSIEGRVRNIKTGHSKSVHYMYGGDCAVLQLSYKGKTYRRSLAKLLRTTFGITKRINKLGGIYKCKNCGNLIPINKRDYHTDVCKPILIDRSGFFEY